MKKFKILYLIEDFGIGGLERIVESLFLFINKDRYKPSIWCIAGGGAIEHKLKKEFENIRVLEFKSYHNPINILKLAILIKKEKFQIVHTHGYFASTMGIISSFLANTPINISHIHTTDWDLKKRNIFVDNILSNLVDKIICCSEAVQKFVVINEGIKKDKTIKIYNGVSNKLKKYCNPLKIFADDEVCIATVASLVKNKGHTYLLEAIHKIYQTQKNIRLIIVGEGPLKNELMNYANELGIEKVVYFLGRKDNVYEILSQIDICVLASTEREGLGLSLLEAMCHSKPIVGTKIGGIPEIIENGYNGYLVLPKNSENLAYRLGNLVNNNSLREEMGKNGKKIFDKKFKQEIMIKNIEHLYENLIIENLDQRG